MRHTTRAQWCIAVAGFAVLAMPGCSSKWLSGGGETSTPGQEQSIADSGSAAGSQSAQADGTTMSSESTMNGLSGSTGPSSDSSGSSSGSDDVSSGNGTSSGYGQESTSPELSMHGGSDRDQYASIDGGALSGFDSLTPGDTPSEERIGRGDISSRMLSSDMRDKRMAELRREEEAAIAAGFRDAFFGYDRASIEGEAHDSLASNADWIKEHPGAKVKVSGHCDERGTQDYNLVLGDKRAKAVKRYLIDLGINPTQITTISFGKNRPFCAEHDESCHRQNRRGHFLLSEH